MPVPRHGRGTPCPRREHHIIEPPTVSGKLQLPYEACNGWAQRRAGRSCCCLAVQADFGEEKTRSVPLISVASACCHGGGETTVTLVQAVTHK